MSSVTVKLRPGEDWTPVHVGVYDWLGLCASEVIEAKAVDEALQVRTRIRFLKRGRELPYLAGLIWFLPVIIYCALKWRLRERKLLEAKAAEELKRRIKWECKWWKDEG